MRERGSYLSLWVGTRACAPVATHTYIHTVKTHTHTHIRAKEKKRDAEGQQRMAALVVMQDARRGMKPAPFSPVPSSPIRPPPGSLPFLPPCPSSRRRRHPDGKPAGALHFRVLQPAGAAKEMKTMRYSGHPLPYARRVS